MSSILERIDSFPEKLLFYNSIFLVAFYIAEQEVSNLAKAWQPGNDLVPI
jgi:hypothetical protein